MKIKIEIENSRLIISLDGRLDTSTAPELESQIADLGDYTELVLDMTNLEYISSAGLRVILKAQKAMNKKGKLVVKNVSESIKEIFDITGFSDFLTIE